MEEFLKDNLVTDCSMDWEDRSKVTGPGLQEDGSTAKRYRLDSINLLISYILSIMS